MSYDPFLLVLKAHGLPAPHTEYRFAPPRQWRADYCWPTFKVIIEKNGGIFTGGSHSTTANLGHSRGANIIRDMEKSNAAQLLGYRYLQYTPRQLEMNDVLETLKELLG